MLSSRAATLASGQVFSDSKAVAPATRPRARTSSAAWQELTIIENDQPSGDETMQYAAFPEDEHRARLARARQALRTAYIACCVSVAPEHLYYFAGYDSWVS